MLALWKHQKSGKLVAGVYPSPIYPKLLALIVKTHFHGGLGLVIEEKVTLPLEESEMYDFWCKL